MGHITVIVAYKPKPGNATALKALTRNHVPRLRAESLVTDREPFILEAADGTIVEVFEWLSQEAIQQAHNSHEVNKMWAEFAEVCDYIPLKDITEAANLFAEFTTVD